MRPPFKKVSSPNFTRGKDRKIGCIVLHATATGGLASPLEWLTLPASQASSHYLIDKNGDIYGLVEEKNSAWHAGISVWNGMEVIGKSGQPSVNLSSIGIELVNPNDGVYPYPEPQVAACTDLVISICRDYGIAAKDVIGHCHVALGRKTDPAGWDWEDFYARLAKEGIA